MTPNEFLALAQAVGRSSVSASTPCACCSISDLQVEDDDSGNFVRVEEFERFTAQVMDLLLAQQNK